MPKQGRGNSQHGRRKVSVTLAKQPRVVRIEGVGPVEISKQLDRRGRLQIVLSGVAVEGFGLTDAPDLV